VTASPEGHSQHCRRAGLRGSPRLRGGPRLRRAPRARDALGNADRAADGLDDAGTSAWSFSRGRQAIFTLSVCLHTGDPDGALRAARDADAYWASGGGKVTATWAQVRAGAAMAHLLKGAPDGAAAELAPVLELPPDQRM
jgi:hypothetical protein